MTRSFLLTLFAFTLFAFTLAACNPVTVADEDGGDAVDAGVPADADPCDTLDCECDVDSECGLHEVCDTTTGPGRVCACAPQYADKGSGCEWDGAPDDPSFMDVTAWQTTGSVAVVPGSTGSVAPGVALFTPAAACEGSTAFQTLTMPSYEVAEPLALDATHRFQSGGGGGGGGGGSAAAAVEVDGYWVDLSNNNTFQTDHVCLGDAAYGGDIRFGVSAAAQAFGCTSILEVDHVEIVPDASCPVPGAVREGDMEAGTGWVAETGGTGAGVIAANVGFNNSNGGQISTQTLCSRASMTGLGSPPAAFPSPSLQVFWHASSGDVMDVSLSNKPIASLLGAGPGAAKTSRICIPHGLTGWAHDLRFALPNKGGSCAAADVREGVFDNVELVNEPACGTDPNVVDGTFEAAVTGAVITPWVGQFNPDRGDVKIVNNASVAQNGSGSLEISVRQECSGASVSTFVNVLPPDGNNGPALQFAYDAPNNPETTFSSSPGNGTLAEGGGYVTETVCLDPGLAGRLQRISFSLSPGGGTCAVTFPNEIVRVDDVQIITSAACPLN